MPGATHELLTLVQRRGTAAEALVRFIARAAVLVQDNVIDHSAETAVALSALTAAVERRQPAWRTRGLPGERAQKRQRTSGRGRNDVVFAAQLAQSIVKVYALMDVAAATMAEKADLVAALDLACVALYVVCALAHTVRLGDLVVENLLYQVAKKYTEMPDGSKAMREAASCVAACVHLRLWNEHTKLCSKSSASGTETSQLMAHLQDAGNVDFATTVAKKLALVAEFPGPTSLHTAQFAQLLLGHSSMCVTLLAATGNHEAVRRVAETTLSPWIDRLQVLSDQHSKLASSFSDRTFRVMWKCAAAVDSGDQNASKATNVALLLRSTALTFALRCPKYTSLYFIQQVHRVGVQHERASKRSHQGLQEVHAFYDRSANALLGTCLDSAQTYKSKSFEWEYVQWLEHFALICEALELHVESATILENAANYAHLFDDTGFIQSCLLFSIAGALLRASGYEKRGDSIRSEAGSSTAVFDKGFGSRAGRIIRDLVHSTSSDDKLVDRCEKAASAHLKKLEVFVTSSCRPLRPSSIRVFAPFVIRCLKRSSIQMYNYTISAQHSANDQLRHQVVTSFAVMCEAMKELRGTPDETGSSVIETLILEELRLHRMAVTLSVRRCVGDVRSSAVTESALHAVSCRVNRIRDLLHDATMDGKSCESTLKRVLGDLKSVARDCYNFAVRYYKAGNYQVTIVALTGAFQVVETYLECVMRSHATADEIHAAHAHLKADDIASLLAHCFRETGDAVRSRQFAEHSLVYCADIHEKTPQASVDKYVSCVLNELKQSGDGAKDFIVRTFKVFLSNVTRVLESRRVSDDRMVMLWNAFRYALELASAKIMDSVRAGDCGEVACTDRASSESCVHLCGVLQSYVDGQLVKFRLKAIDGKLFDDILLDVSQSLARRKHVYCCFYAKCDFSATMEDLLLVHHSLSTAAEKLQSLAGALSVDLGGVYGWRGVITMEIALIASYAGLSASDATREKAVMSENSAIADIEQCLKYWDTGCTSGFLFDVPYVMCCLHSVCNTLSIAPCSPLEDVARKLRRKLQRLADEVVAPELWLLDPDMSVDRLIVEYEVATSTDAGIDNKIGTFELADKALLAAESAQANGNKGQTCQHLRDAMAMLGGITPSQRQGRTAVFAKAVGMREYIAHVILSDLYFHEGRSTCAIAEAKAALRLCWKMAKTCTASSSSTGCTAWFELPSEIAIAKSQERKPGYLLDFMALESLSWDLLLAAKMILCRLASLYTLCDQPRRATAYLMEAMRLVGGLNLRFFRRSPFYEYAELELNASHVKKAKVAISLLSFSRKRIPDQKEADCTDHAMTSWHHSCIGSDVAFIEQRCKEVVQQGDVYETEGNYQQALACFGRAREALDAVEDKGHLVSTRLGRARARCWRKYARLQSQVCDFSDSAAVEALLVSMKRLKQSVKACGQHLERVKCLLELGRINTRLLRSASPRAFTSLGGTIACLEEAYLLGDHLGIAYLSQELRAALGMAYFAEIEDNTGSKDDPTSDRVPFLAWMSGALLANSGSAGMVAVKEMPSFELGSDKSPRDSLTVQLEHLAASSAPSHELESHKTLTNMAQSISKQVGHLPDDWVIVSVTITSSDELVITRVQTNGRAPISFCLSEVAWATCIREVDAIIQDSREVLSGHTAEEASSWNAEQKEKWWCTRKLLDERIDKALVSMQETLGFWRCLLVGGPSTPDRIQRCWEILVSSKQGPTRLVERNQTLLCAIADSQQSLSDCEVIDGLKHIAAEIGAPVSDSAVREALRVLRSERTDTRSNSSKAALSTLAKLSTERLARMKVGEVRQHLAAEGLSTDGSKKAMIERLIAARAAALSDEYLLPMKRSHGDTDNPFSTILILHHELQQFPWEGMDVMGHSSGVTRMPSLELILENAKCSPLVRRDRVHFVLNPAGDLRSTEHQLGPIVADGVTAYGWEGTVGKAPDPDELRNRLEAADLFVYCGHGSGETYLPRNKVLGLQPNCSAALLFGCSSGRLEREGIFGPHGAVLAYLRAGSPAVLAMLWDVTDRDIDQLSVKVLQDWLLANTADVDGRCRRRLALAKVLHDSRTVCKLKYLNGHAAICYGLPLYVANHRTAPRQPTTST
ncbi:unnamed protein product [Hyaloperonospora brassicae]|uniref:separase n=1 Tax=Hyaloperonospora brassicae TaxID=162125 RepID=A0AAV0T197_HYABA|nr:unnamed protein product [Hyaloperonospora brassicae]